MRGSGRDAERDRAGPGAAGAPGRAALAGLLAAWLLLAGGPATAAAQEPPIEADRPGLGFAPSTVGPIHLQLEMGAPEIAYTSFASGEDWVFTFPMLGRLGIVDGFEVRAGLSPLTVDVREGDPGVDDRAEVGPGDLELGVKWRFLEGDGAAPTFLFVPSVTLPTGESGIGRERSSFQGTLQASWGLGGDFGMNLFMGAGLEPDDDDWSGTGILGADLGFPLGGELNGYAEIGWLPTSAGTDDLLAGGGATWRLTPWAQIDTFVDVGLTGSSTDWIVGAGFARRF